MHQRPDGRQHLSWDLLLKNFGVTGNGRVVFYDYDEVAFITSCNFRDLTMSRSEDEEMAEESWRAVAENDVFPAEFGRFIGLQGMLREVFQQQHGDLFDARSWQSVQKRLQDGEMIFIIPYDRGKRLRSEAPIA